MTPRHIIPTPSRIIDGAPPAPTHAPRPHPFFQFLKVLAFVCVGTALGALGEWVASWLM